MGELLAELETVDGTELEEETEVGIVLLVTTLVVAVPGRHW